MNDKNLLVSEGNGALASQYAGKIMEIYAQYRWRQSVQDENGKPRWSGLPDDDRWQVSGQDASADKRRVREPDFWFGTRTDA